MPDKEHSSSQVCFVCEQKRTDGELRLNKRVLLNVCDACSGTEAEKKKEQELLEGMADGFVCGCI